MQERDTSTGIDCRAFLSGGVAAAAVLVPGVARVSFAGRYRFLPLSWTH